MLDIFNIKNFKITIKNLETENVSLREMLIRTNEEKNVFIKNEFLLKDKISLLSSELNKVKEELRLLRKNNEIREKNSEELKYY